MNGATIDVAAVRADTPACQDVLHFNNAGAALMPNAVVTAVTDHIERERTLGGYEAERAAADELAAFYTGLAGLLRCNPQEIAYVENATRAWDMAFYGLQLEKDDRILTHASEYASNYLAFLQQSRRRGIHIDVVPSDTSGQVDVDAMDAMVGPRTRVIAVVHAPSQGGLVNPAAAIGRVAKRHRLIYLLDACQSVGQIEVDVGRIGCHVLSGTGRKFLRGPRGTGFLYVAEDMIERIEPAFIDMRAATWTGPDEYRYAAGARRYETWESNVAARLGLASAVRYAQSVGLAAIESRVGALAALLRDALAAVPGVRVHDRGSRLSGIVTFSKQGETAAGLADRLAARRINVSTTARQTAVLDFDERGIDELVRASVHYYNTENEIDRFVHAVQC